MKKLLLLLSLGCFPAFAQTTTAIIFADQVSQPGQTPATTPLQWIIDNKCPTSPNAGGCVIYDTSPNANLNLGDVDPGLNLPANLSREVTIYLGPFTYNVDIITLRSGLKIIGMGATFNGTVLQSTNTINQPLFKLPPGISNNPVTDVYLNGFRLLANLPNSTQSGIILDCSTLTNAGLWHSTFEDLFFQGFQGSAIWFFGPNNLVNGGPPALNQFVSMRNIWATRPSATAGPDLRMEGSNGQIDCVECHFDGPGGPTSGVTDQWTNVFIGNLSGGTARPYSVHFFNLSTQFAHFGVEIEGAQHLTFIGTHHEDLFGAYQILNAGGVGTIDVLLSNDSFAGNVGRNGGYLVYADNAYNVILDSSFINGGNPNPPSSIVTGPWSGNVSLRNIYDFYTSPQQFSVFAGNLQIIGTLSKAAGSFKIDHPLDPKNKYLSHSFVESPDMMNIYNGVVVLGKNGSATVKLPAYFEALNRDFRYQLTSIGGFVPVFISQEIKNNVFRISGGRPGVKVSWQVTGVRHDAYANAHRINVEQEKSSSERGHLLYPPTDAKVKDALTQTNGIQ